jgi:hypothetical protein
MLITPLFVHSSLLLKVIVLSTNVDKGTNGQTMGKSTLGKNTITLSKKDERTNDGVISIGGQHNNLK